MDRVAQLDTVKGFTGGSKLMIDLQLWEISPICCQIMWGQKCQRSFGELQLDFLVMIMVTEMEVTMVVGNGGDTQKARRSHRLSRSHFSTPAHSLIERHKTYAIQTFCN